MSTAKHRNETTRQRLRAALGGLPVTARELSQKLRLSEQEVLEHLPHVARSLAAEGRALAVVPARCRGCGFEFEARLERARPGRCPECKGERVQAARFGLRPEGLRTAGADGVEDSELAHQGG